jgi:hypothetical protein
MTADARTGWVHAALYDFNCSLGFFTVRHPDGGYRGPLEIGDDVILYEPDNDGSDREFGDGFGAVAKVTRIEQSKYDPDWDLIYTDYPDRLRR